MAEHLNQPREEIPDAFAAMGKPIHLQARQLGYLTCKDMGLSTGAAWLAVKGMAEQLERDQPYEAQRVAMRYMDLTGAYRLMSVLLVAALEPAPAMDPEVAADLEQMRALHDVYVRRAKARGVRFLPYTVPCCGAQMESAAGPETGQWDTLASCCYCGALYMKISTASAIEARTLEDEPTGGAS